MSLYNVLCNDALNDRCNLYARNLYGYKGTPRRPLSCSPAFAFFIDLSLPYGLRSQSSAEIANGVTRGEKRNTGAAIPRLPKGNEPLSAVTVTRGEINCRISAFSSYNPVFFLHFARHIDFHSPLPYIVSRTFT